MSPIDPNLEDEEAKLLARLREIQEAKRQQLKYDADWDLAIQMNEEYDRKQAELRKPVMIDSIEIVSERIHFRVNPMRADIEHILKTTKTYQLNWIDSIRSVEVEQWMPLVEKLMKLPSVYIKYGNTSEEDVKNWKKPADYYIYMDNRGFLVKCSTKSSKYILRDIPGSTWDHQKMTFRFPFPEGWRIAQAIETLNANNEWTVEWDEETKTAILNQISQRARLDTLATAKHPTQDIYLADGTIKLHDFQAVSVEFAEAAGGNVLIGHEMGLGKTPCAIAVCERMAERNEGSKFLIVVPASLKPNWIREIKKFTGFGVYECYGERPQNYDLAQIVAGKHRYYLINYDILSARIKIPEEFKTVVDPVTGKEERHRIDAHERFLWVEALNLGRFDAVVVDEAHYIKNVDSLRSRAVRNLQIPRSILLTGTPILNRPSELWPLINKLDPVVAGPYETFVNYYTVDGKTARNVDDLREVLKPLMIRRIKKDVLTELPPIQRIIRDFELSNTARRQYNAVLDGLWADLNNWDGSTSNTQAITSILAQLMKMKQVVAWDKVDYIVDLANELYEQSTNGHRKVIIFSQFVNKPAVVKEIADKLNTTAKFTGGAQEALWFGGEQSPSERQAIVDKFQTNDEHHFLVCGLKSAREGLNITAAGSVIFADLDWTPANHHQAEARAYGRLSDLHSINSYYVIADETIEESIWELLAVKLNLFNAIIEGTEEARDTSVAMEVIRRLKERGR